ncbi:unnamed protein product [Lathyrus oleraceus]
MAQILILIYALIFSFLFLVVTNDRIPCIIDHDCPFVRFPLYIKCIYYSYMFLMLLTKYLALSQSGI